MSRPIKALCVATLALIAGHASGATTWTLNTGTVNGVGDNPAITATATAWANTGAGGTVDTQVLEQQNAPGNFALYSGGLGINNRDGTCTTCTTGDTGDVASTAPEHAIDNNQRYEMVMLAFNSRVNLTGVTFGWTGTSDYGSGGGDSDYTILAYTPLSAPATLAGQTWGALQSGWSAIGNYANATTNTQYATGTAVYSSYWLIGAYNPLAGGNSNWTLGNDYLKLKSVVGNVRVSETSVPEPGSMALIGLALLSMLYVRQRPHA